ncbi:MAG: TetR family transcriptional regulator [Phycisphaerae bacterium]|nr:MAG: TetR family transcriptional regulator [Phycisphaerae bacterium]
MTIVGIVERKEREKEELRRKIMTAARKLFVEQGIENTSIRKIAEAIEYSPTVIYLHFPDKESLLQEICREDFAALHAAEASIGRIDDPVQKIRAIGMAYMKFGVEHPEQYQLMFMRRHAPPTADDLKERGDPTCDGYAILEHAVQDALQQGRIRPEYRDLSLICQTLWAGVHGTVAIEITMKSNPWIQLEDFEVRARTMLDVLIRGMCNNEPSS